MVSSRLALRPESRSTRYWPLREAGGPDEPSLGKLLAKSPLSMGATRFTAALTRPGGTAILASPRGHRGPKEAE